MKIFNCILMVMWLISAWMAITRYERNVTASAIATGVLMVITIGIFIMNKKEFRNERRK